MQETSIKRAEARFSWTSSSQCDVSHEHGHIRAALKDISRGGAKIDYPGGPLGCGATVMVRIAVRQVLLSRPAMVVWSKGAAGERAASGLKFLDPVPATSLIIFSKEAKDHFFN